MPLSHDDLQTPLTAEQVRALLLEILAREEFPVEAWQDEGAALALIEGQAALGASLSERVAELAKQGFLSSAVATHLTALVASHYDETRYPATASVLPVTYVNSGAANHGPLSPGELVVKDSTGQTFSNTGAVTIAAGATVESELIAQTPGAAGNIAAQTLELVTPLAGVSATFSGTLTTVGSDQERDPQLRSRARTKWATLRIEKAREGVLNLARAAAPNIFSVTVDDSNPRGAGTLDVYLSAENSTAGTSDVELVQAALDLAFFGQGEVVKRVQAFAAPTITQDITATVYVAGTTEADALTDLNLAIADFFPTIPIGGFDLSPGPSNIIQRGQIIDGLTEAPNVLAVDLTTPATDPTISSDTKVLPGVITFNVVVVAGGD